MLALVTVTFCLITNMTFFNEIPSCIHFLSSVPLPFCKSCSAKTGSDKRPCHRRQLSRAPSFISLSRRVAFLALHKPDSFPRPTLRAPAPRPSRPSSSPSIRPSPPRAPASSSSLSPVALLHGPPSPACLPAAGLLSPDQPACLPALKSQLNFKVKVGRGSGGEGTF